MQQRAFNRLDQELSSPTILVQYCLNRETKIEADPSSFRLQPSGDWRPVAFSMSDSMSDAECRYAQIEKEALTLVWHCEAFLSYLLGKDMLIQTDIKPLIWAAEHLMTYHLGLSSGD